MDEGVGAAARLPGRERKDLAVRALAGAATVTDLAARHGVSRKFVYQQTHKAAWFRSGSNQVTRARESTGLGRPDCSYISVLWGGG